MLEENMKVLPLEVMELIEKAAQRTSQTSIGRLAFLQKLTSLDASHPHWNMKATAAYFDAFFTDEELSVILSKYKFHEDDFFAIYVQFMNRFISWRASSRNDLSW